MARKKWSKVRPPLDDAIVVAFCGDADHRAQNEISGVYRLAVDDFCDDDEAEITSEEIHVTCLRADYAKKDIDIPFCFKLSTTSAKMLVADLVAAIRRRENP